MDQSPAGRALFRATVLVGAILFAAPASAQDTAIAQDTVTIATSAGGKMRLTGRVVDYNGRELKLESLGGQTRSIPAASVLVIDTQYGQRQTAAEAALGQGRFAEAAALYQQAMADEPRTWVRRQIIARLVRCHRALGQDERAGENFLLLIRSDPVTPYFDCIPLAWLPRQPSPEVDRAARAWATREEPAARLLAASWLLTTADRPAAQAALLQLASSDDKRIAQLASAQTWRAAVATASSGQLDAWRRSIDEMPDALQSGPFFALGQGRLQRQQWPWAALALLRAAVLGGNDRSLAAHALLDAGRALEQMGQTAEAARLYREVLGTYGDDMRTSAEARARLDATEGDKSPLTVSPPAVAPDATAEQRFLAALRQRGLTMLAEAYCTSELTRAELPDARRAELTIELSRALAEQAVAAPSAERAALWDRAAQVVVDFARQHPQSERLPLVRLQGALAALARGELAAQEALLLGEGTAKVDEARLQLRAAIRQLGDLAAEVEQRLRQPSPAGRASADGLTSAQWLSLQRNVAYELSRAYRNQALCYPRGSDDQTAALLQAAKLIEPLANLDAGEPLRNRSRIDLIVCYRLLSDFATAERIIETMMEEKPPAESVLRLRAERIRLALAAGRLAEAIGVVGEGRQLQETTLPDLDLAWLETYLAAWQAAVTAKDQPQADEWLKRADDAVRGIEQLHGPVWKRRAEMLMAGAARALPGGEDLSLQIRVAENEYRSGRPDEALAAYDRARQAAEKQQNASLAFDLGFTAATIEHQRERHQQARDRYRQLALGDPRHAKAAEAHLLAIANAAEIAKAPAAGAIEQYVALLEEHARQWKAGATVDEARQRLGRIREFQRDWPAAVAAYRAVGAGYAEYLSVVEAVGRCYEAWLRQQQAAGQPTEPLATEAARWFESLLLGNGNAWPTHWGPVERYAALAAARLWMNYTSNGYPRAEQLLAAAIAGGADAPPAWRSAAEMLRVCALAGGGKRDEAARWLDRAAGGSMEQLMGLLDGLGRIAADARPEAKREVAALQLRTIELIEPRRAELSDAVRKGLDRRRAQALADAGRNDEALNAFKSLAEGDPRDIAVQEGYARQLAARGDRASLEAALRMWAELQRNWNDGSEPWLRAQFAMASLQYRLGDRKQAAQRLKLVQRLHPDAGPAELRAEMADLLRKCQ